MVKGKKSQDTLEQEKQNFMVNFLRKASVIKAYCT